MGARPYSIGEKLQRQAQMAIMPRSLLAHLVAVTVTDESAAPRLPEE
jgi:hypothetical protein